MPISNGDMQTIENDKRQKLITVVEWLMLRPDEWFSAEEIMENFSMWKCMKEVMKELDWNHHGKIVDIKFKTVTKMTEYETIPNVERCESISYYKINDAYLAKRRKWESSGRFNRLFIEKVFPYKEETE